MIFTINIRDVTNRFNPKMVSSQCFVLDTPRMAQETRIDLPATPDASRTHSYAIEFSLVDEE